MAARKYSANVYPKQPTMLGDKEEIGLPGYELWMTFIKNVHVVSFRLDRETFLAALSGALQWYPHAAGRLRKEGSDWKITLSNSSSILVEAETRESLGVGIDGVRVIRDDLSDFLNTLPSGRNVVNTDAPLLRFKLTLAKRETAIGVSWHHTLGDANLLLRFMRLLSHNYQGLPPPDSAPIFTKHVFPDPSAELVHEYLPSMPHLAQTYPHAALGTAYAQMNRTTERIDLHIEGHKLHSLRERVMGHLKGTGVQLSIQDCLTAYLVTALNRCLGDPIHEITNAASYRHLPLPFVDGNVVGNAIYIIPTRLSKGSLSLCDVAVAIRSTLERCRTSEYVEWWMCVASHIMLAAANEDRSLFFSTPLGRLSVNSNTALDWCFAHFGSPESARFFTSGVNERYVRVFRSNPVLSEDGKWITRDQDFDVTFGIAGQYKSLVMDIVTSELDSPEFPANIDIQVESTIKE